VRRNLQHFRGFFGIQQAIVEAEAALYQSLSDFLAHGQPHRVEEGLPEQLARFIDLLIIKGLEAFL
jgi:hypothetical protein